MSPNTRLNSPGMYRAGARLLYGRERSGEFMPKSMMDWMSVAMLWLGAAIEAIVGAQNVLPHLNDADHPILTSGWWAFAPLLLVSVAAVLAGRATFRAMSIASATPPALDNPAADPTVQPGETVAVIMRGTGGAIGSIRSRGMDRGLVDY